MRSEARRYEQFNQIREDLLGKGYREAECTISIVEANAYALLCALPFFIVGIALYFALWVGDGISLSFSFSEFVLFVLVFVASIVVHELLHGLGWGLFCKNGFKSISFGVIWKMLTPYCHCKEPLFFRAYLFGGLLPFFVLGIVPLAVALVIGNAWVLAFALISILGAGGDLTIASMLMKHRDALVVDHPSECGFYAYTK